MKALLVVASFGIWVFVIRYSTREEKRKLNDFAWIMCGIPGTLVMWWVISLTFKLI